MSRLEVLDRDTWEAFVASPRAHLMIGKSDCAACASWTEELERFLAEDGSWSDVRFGKVLLDTPGLGRFKKANPWLAGVEVLPFNVLLEGGEVRKQWPGGGLERLVNRLRNAFGGADGA